MVPTIRRLHHRLSPWIYILLIVSAVTGVAYRAGRQWFALSDDMGDKLMTIHAGEWLGPIGSPLYVLLVGLALLSLLASGLVLLIKSRARKGARNLHRILGAILFLPLTASAVTGILAKLGEDWFGFTKPTLHLLLNIHQGSWLGKDLRVFYVLFVGLGLLLLGLAGLRLTGLFGRSSGKR